MAALAPEIDLLPGGMNPDRLDKGPFIQNFERVGDAWQTRGGFGQVAQFDTTLGFDNVTYEQHLGSGHILTDFGHEQILSVFRLRTFTGSVWRGLQARVVGRYATLYAVSIYDVTTDVLWEEILVPGTAGQRSDIRTHHGVYETNRTRNYEDLITGAVGEERCFFGQLDDVLYFGNRRLGLWCYVPATFRSKPRTNQLDGHDRQDWVFQGRSESSLLLKASASDGLFTDAYAYFTTSEFPTPVDVAVLNRRLVIASGRFLYFSDPGRPTSIMADNFLELPAEQEITAVHVFRGNVLVWTATEMFLYQPSDGALVTAGPLVEVSGTVGCIGPNAVQEVNGVVYWVDRTGLHRTRTGLDLDEVSKQDAEGPEEEGVGFSGFWRDTVANPLTSYYQQSGFSGLTSDQPRLLWRHIPDGVHLVYDHVHDALLLVEPDQAMAWVLQQGRWHTWNFESTAAAANSVRVLRNVRAPWLVMATGDLFLVGSSDTLALTDTTLIGGITGVPGGENWSVGSWCLLRYGRGGGLDRSIEYTDEDDRRVTGKVYGFDSTMTAAAGHNAVYIGEWIPVPTSFVFPGGAVAPPRTYLLPVEIVLDDTHTGVDRIRLTFRFDSTHWAAVLRSGSEVDFLLGPERAQSRPGYAPGAPVAGTREVQIYNSVTGLVSPTGNELRLRWDGTAAGYTGSFAPFMNLSRQQRNRLIYLPFRYAGPTDVNVASMGIDGILAEIQRVTAPAVATQACDFWAWQQAEFNTRHVLDDVAQPVDYVLRTDEVGYKSSAQVRLRTLFMKLLSHGSASSPIQSTSVFGLLNVLIGSDWKGWTSQIVDYVGTTAGGPGGDLSRATNHQSLRTRVRDSGGTMRRRVFNGNLTWGNTANSAHGNFLIDDEQVDTVAISDSVRGEHVAAMIFGHIRSAAERLVFHDLKAALRVVGGRRRTGR